MKTLIILHITDQVLPQNDNDFYDCTTLFLIYYIIISKLDMTISIFKPGERVKIIGEKEDSHKIYNIKKISRYQNEITLYILESEFNQISRLYYETKNSSLERIYSAKIRSSDFHNQ
ncbi:MAG: hypothetical protein ACREA8_00735 [Nitrosotalea sp.]